MPVAVPKPLRYLRNHRNRPLHCTALARALAGALGELGALAAAVGRDLDDPRWAELGAAVEGCARELRRLG